MRHLLRTIRIHDCISRPLNLRKTQRFHLNCIVYVRACTHHWTLHLRENTLRPLDLDLRRKVVGNSWLVRIFTLMVISLVVLVEIGLGSGSIYVDRLEFGPTFLIHAILLQSSLTYGGHKWGLMRRNCWFANWITRVEWLIYCPVKLHQILENLCCSQISITRCRETLPINHLFTLINESSSHLKQFTPWEHIFAIVDRPWLILNAGHLKKLHGVWRNSSARQTILVESYRDFVCRNFNAILWH